MRIFEGRRTDIGALVLFDGEPLGLPALRPGEVRHSPTGFNFGYGGSGPAELARAMLIAVLPDEPAARHPACYQQFKFDFVAQMDRAWIMSEATVLAWFSRWRAAAGREVADTLDGERRSDADPAGA